MFPSAVSARRRLAPLGAPWLTLLLLAGACSPDLTGPPQVPEALPSVPLPSVAQIGDVIPGRHIVVFRNAVTDAPGQARQLVETHRGTLRFTYQHALKGFAADLPDAAVAALRKNPNVEFVEPVTVGSAGTLYSSPVVQTNATWGLDRIDQRARPLSGSYSYTETGETVRVYIVDSGIDTFHPEFEGRARNVFDAVDPSGGPASAVTTQRDGDCTNGGSGHGTHVAGTTGGKTYGVAKQALLLGVRVLYCNKLGATDLSVAGLDWVAKNATAPAVVNFSMMHDSSTAVDRAAQGIVNRGLMFVTIATNSFQSVPGTNLSYGGDACRWSPARISRVSDAITIASSNINDARSSWSGYGACVTLFAPGEGIKSATPNNGAGTWNGTSMAAPHVAGAIARHLERNPAATVSEIKRWLLTSATANVITDPQGSPNLLLYKGSEVPAALPPAAPSNLAATAVSSSQIGIRWADNSGNESGFKIERAPDNAGAPGAYAEIAVVGANVTSYSNTGLSAGTKHWYRVRAYNAAGNSTYSNAANATTASTSTLPPTNLSATGTKVKGFHHVALKWTKGSAATVDIWRNSGKVRSAISNAGSYTDNTGKKGANAQYRYQVCVAGKTGSTNCSNAVTVHF